MTLSRVERIDRFGHCVFCTHNLITKKVVDGKVIEMFTPDHGHTEFLLNNGSRMQVCMCRKCRENIDLDNSKIHEMIMDAVQKGWKLETEMLVSDDKLPEWTQEHADKYLENMGKLNIHCHSDNLDKNIVERKQKELLSNVGKEVLK